MILSPYPKRSAYSQTPSAYVRTAPHSRTKAAAASFLFSVIAACCKRERERERERGERREERGQRERERERGERE